MNTIEAKVLWIGEAHGGRKSPPFIGMRPTIRWQRDVGTWCTSAWDVQVVDLREDGHVKLAISPDAIVPENLDVPGEGIELLDGHRVIAVGIVQDWG